MPYPQDSTSPGRDSKPNRQEISYKYGHKYTTDPVKNILVLIALHHGVLEKAGSESKVITVQGTFGWTDVGSWSSLHQMLPHDRQGNAALGRWLGIDSRNCLVHGGERLVVLLGMDKAMVVDTPDAILVGDLNRVQEMRRVVQELELSGYGRMVREFSR